MGRDETTSPAVALRKLRLGDRWSYSVAGALASPDGGTLPLTGEIEVSIVPDELPGRADQMAIQFSQNFEVLQPDGARKALPAPTWMFSIVQNADTADVAIAADNMGPGGARRIGEGASGLLSRALDKHDRLRQSARLRQWRLCEEHPCRSSVRNGSKRPAESSSPGNRRSPARAWRWAGSRAWTGGRLNSGRPCASRRTPECPTGLVLRFLATLSDSNVLTG